MALAGSGMRLFWWPSAAFLAGLLASPSRHGRGPFHHNHMSAAGRQSFSKNIFPGDDSIAGSAPNQLAAPRVVGLRPKQHVFSALPLACRGFLTAVFIDVFLMASYSTILLATGISSSAFYFAALILSTCVTLVYFSISAIRSPGWISSPT